MIDGLTIWGLTRATQYIFTPVLEDLAKDVAKDAAKSYVGKAFASAFSVIHKIALTRATGRALQALLELIENELLDADVSEDALRGMRPQLRAFVEQPAVQGCLEPLFLDPDYHLDPQLFATAWALPEAPELPQEFSWQRISKRFARHVADPYQVRPSPSPSPVAREPRLRPDRESWGIWNSCAIVTIQHPAGRRLRWTRRALIERSTI
jgi:hypothetical protein